jgi:hypothetical protein
MDGLVEARQHLEMALELLIKAKPIERSEETRRVAIVITELEKVLSYFLVFVQHKKS